MDGDESDQAVDGGGRRHPRWGIVAQVTAIVGSVGLVLAIGLTWVVYSSTSGTVNGLLADLDAMTAEAQGKYDAAAMALDEQAGKALNEDAQSLLGEGADLVREVGSQVASVEGQIADLVTSLLTALLLVVAMLTALLVYLVLVHGGLWTLGRHWRRD
jgi:predicted PurR-regulated permease PerM